MASTKGSHDAPAMIMGWTTDTSMNPLSWNTIPATSAPSRLAPNVRANR